MKTFYGTGAVTFDLLSNGKKIGEDWGYLPIYRAQAEDEDAAKKLPVSAWEAVDSTDNGRNGAIFEEGFSAADVDDEIVRLHYVYDLEEARQLNAC